MNSPQQIRTERVRARLEGSQRGGLTVNTGFDEEDGPAKLGAGPPPDDEDVLELLERGEGKDMGTPVADRCGCRALGGA